MASSGSQNTHHRFRTPAQVSFQLFSLQRPTLVLGLHSLFDPLALVIEGSSLLLMDPLGPVHSFLRLIDCVLTPFALFCSGDFSPRLFSLAMLLLPFVGKSGRLLRCLVDGTRRCPLRFAALRRGGRFDRFAGVVLRDPGIE
jgi:hypothetical protein